MRNLRRTLCAATPLPSRGGAGVGSVYSSLSDIYRPHPGLRPPLPLKGGEWLRLPLRQYVDFLKWTQFFIFSLSYQETFVSLHTETVTHIWTRRN